MTTQAVVVKHGHAADFSTMGRPLSWYQDLAQHSDVTVVLIDMMSQGWAQDFHYALQAGFGATLFQGFDPTAFTQPAEARLRGRMMVAAVQSVGLAKHSDVFVDWESVPSTVSEQAAIQWIANWINEVATSDARPGIYEGPVQPITEQGFDTHFPNARRWKSLSIVPPLTTGYVLLQKHGNVNHKGYAVDWDVIQPDKKGRTLTVTQQAGSAVPTNSPPASSTATSSTMAQKVATLTTQVSALNGLAHDLRKALDAFPS